MAQERRRHPKIVGHKIVGRHIRFEYENGEHTAWPWPFGGERDSASWKARYAPDTLTAAEAMELADVACCYATIVTQPSRSLRETVHALHRAYEQEVRKNAEHDQ